MHMQQKGLKYPRSEVVGQARETREQVDHRTPETNHASELNTPHTPERSRTFGFGLKVCVGNSPWIPTGKIYPTFPVLVELHYVLGTVLWFNSGDTHTSLRGRGVSKAPTFQSLALNWQERCKALWEHFKGGWEGGFLERGNSYCDLKNESGMAIYRELQKNVELLPRG
jgi:hypothetical protein